MISDHKSCAGPGGTLLKAEEEGNPKGMPDGVGTPAFMEAWNEYIEKNPVKGTYPFRKDTEKEDG